MQGKPPSKKNSIETLMLTHTHTHWKREEVKRGRERKKNEERIKREERERKRVED